MNDFKIAIVGRGRVGGTLERVLQSKECRICDALKEADVIFLTVPDDVIESKCADLVQKKEIKEGAYLLHCSGAKPSEILALARSVGASIASMHPLQSFAGESVGNPFKGIVMSIEGDEPAVKRAQEIAQFLEAQPVKIDGQSKALYHASAVVASNYLVTLLELSLALAEKAGLDRQAAMKGFMPLIQGTLSNISEKGSMEALTGPLARGDVGTIQDHMDEIAKKAPDLMDLYKSLGYATLPLAVRKGALNIDQIDNLKALLERK